MLVVILLVRTGYVGFRGGLSGELPKIVGLTLGFFVSFRWYQGIGDWIATHSFLTIEWAAAVVMVFLTVVGFLGFTRLIQFLERFAQVNFTGRLEPVGGLLVGTLRGGFIASVFLVVLHQLPSPYLESSIRQRSLTGTQIFQLAPSLYDAIRVTPRWLADKMK